MASGIPYDSAEGRALCGAITAIMTGIAYATSAEMARRARRLPRLCGRTARPCCGSCAIIAAPPMATPDGYEEARPPRRCRSITRICPDRSW